MVHLSQNFLRFGWLRHCFLAFYLLTALPIFAQVQKGQFHLGGEFYIDANPWQKFYAYSNIQPSVGLMLSPKWSVGLGLPIQYSGGNGYHAISLGVGPFARRYIDWKSNFFLILHTQVNTQFNLSGAIRPSELSAHFFPAINYFVSPRFGVEASFAEFSHSFYRIDYNSPSLEWQYSRFWFYVRPSFSIRYYFLKKGSEAIAITH